MAIKLRIKTVDADIQRTWTSGGRRKEATSEHQPSDA